MLLLPGFTYQPSQSSHLHIVLTEPSDVHVGTDTISRVAIVKLTSLRDKVGAIKPRADQSVVLRKGEHDWIEHDSYVHYGDAQLQPAKALVNGFKTRGFIIRDSLKFEIFERVKDGLLLSDKVPDKVLDFCRSAWP